VSDQYAAAAAAKREAVIQQRLAVLLPQRCELIDDSARHAGLLI